MSIEMQCIGCRENKMFIDFDPYPVCDSCQEWERNKFREEHEETYFIRQRERSVIHNGYRDGYVKQIKTQTVQIKRPPIPNSFRWDIFERDNFTCRVCGTRKYLSVDHIIPFSKGGELTLENCQTLCRSCNSRKGAR